MNEPVQLTYAQKKYLFAIYKLGQNGGVVKSSEIAKIVGVSKASTAIMTEKLAESGLLLCAAMMLTGCAPVENAESQSTTVVSQEDISQASDVTTESKSEIVEWKDIDVQYDSLNDKLLLAHIEDLIYSETVRNLNSEQYFVENVSAVYLSKEYLEEVAYNSQSNIYFGYTLAELNDLFQGTKYVFTLGEDGKTTVKELVEIQDTTNEEILKNVAIGTGVILICVTVSVVTGGAGAPAISAIFAASAKTGAIMAVSSAAIGGVSAGVVRGIETGDMNKHICLIVERRFSYVKVHIYAC